MSSPDSDPERAVRVRNLISLTIAESEALGVGLAESLRAALEAAGDSVGGTLAPEAPATGAGGSAAERFDVLEVLGRGGMGEVRLAKDRDLFRPVAVKTLRHPDRPDHVRRFIDEARVTGQLEHPNIVPVHELRYDETTGAPCLVMKLVEGDGLDRILDGLRGDAPTSLAGTRPGTPARALTRLLEIFLKICDAVAYAHSRGVVHRDLKPANVMVGRFGEVLVMDWGLARVLGRGTGEAMVELSDLGDDSPFRTKPGSVSGTPIYMAPEQARGDLDAIDFRSDVYSLGAILYELLSLSRPFEGGTAAIVLAAVAEGRLTPPSRRSRAPWPLPAELESVVLRAMALSREDRYASAGDLRSEIEAFLAGRTLASVRYSIAARALKWLRRNRAVAIASASVAAAGLLLGIGLSMRSALERRARVAEAIDRSRAAAGEARATSGGASERRLALALEAASAADRALLLSPGDPVAARVRLEAGQVLGEAALESGDYTLARRAYADLALHGASEREVAGLLAAVEERQGQVLRARGERLQAILARLAAEEVRPDEIEDLVFEASGFRDRQTVEILDRALSALAARAREEGVRWRPTERITAAFACRVLGRVELAEAVEPLARWIGAISDEDLVYEAALALCNTRRPEARPAVDRALVRTGFPIDVLRRLLGPLEKIPWTPAQEPDPRDFGALLEAAAISTGFSNHRGACRFLEAALEVRPHDPVASRRLAASRVALGDARGALAALDAAGASLEADPMAHLCRGDAHAALGEPAAAAEAYRRALELEPSATAWRQLGSVLLTAADLVGAADAATRSIELDPGWAATWLLRAGSRHGMGLHAAAIEDYGTALAIDPLLVAARKGRAIARADLEDWGLASEDFSSILERDPDDSLALAGRAAARAMLGDHEGADRNLARLDRDRLGSMSRAYVARVHAIRGESEAAVRECDRSIEEFPSSFARMTRGEALLSLGQADRAIRDFAAVAQAEPEGPRSLTALAIVRMLTRDVPGAEAALAAAIRLDERWWPAWRKLAQVRTLQGRRGESRRASAEAWRLAPAAVRVQIGHEVEALLAFEGQRPWGPEQATGEPDVPGSIDYPTAWAPLASDGGPEWLLVEFERAVEVARIVVHENLNPGCVTRLAAVVEGDREVTLWEGRAVPSGATFAPALAASASTRRVKVELDPKLRPGWEEIDAVELVGTDGSRQWASGASASSFYAR